MFLPLTTPTEVAPGFDLRRYLRIVRRRWLLIAVTALLVVAAALSFSLTETPTYSASAEIVFTPQPGALTATASTESIDPARDVETQIEVLTSGPVRQQVAKALNVAVAPRITAAAVTDANAFVITADSTNAAQAAHIANTYANTYIAFSRNQMITDLLDASQAIQSRIDQIQIQINGITSQINSAPPASAAGAQANLGPQRDALVAQQSALKQQLAESELAQTLANTGAQLGSPAPVPTSPSSPHPLTSAVAGLFGGVIVGLVAAFLVDYVDDTIISREDAERAAYGLPTLAVTPPIPGWKNRRDAVVPTKDAPASPAAEAYRSLRTTLQFLAADRSLHAVLVTSPGTGEGKSTTLANLAVAFGRGGARVCAVDGDLRCPRLHEFFDLSPEPGLTSVVVGEAPLSKAVRPLPEACISLLAAGAVPKNPSELLGSGRMSGVLASLAAQFDMVLIDSPPVLPVTDAAALARHVDGVVVVVDAGNTKRRALTRAVEMLHQVKAPLLGLVVNRGAEEARYGYSYTYPATPRRAGRGRDKNSAPGPGVSAVPGASGADHDELVVVAAAGIAASGDR